MTYRGGYDRLRPLDLLLQPLGIFPRAIRTRSVYYQRTQPAKSFLHRNNPLQSDLRGAIDMSLYIVFRPYIDTNQYNPFHWQCPMHNTASTIRFAQLRTLRMFVIAQIQMQYLRHKKPLFLPIKNLCKRACTQIRTTAIRSLNHAHKLRPSTAPRQSADIAPDRYQYYLCVHQLTICNQRGSS